MNIYNNDSPACTNNDCGISQEDMWFMKLMEDEVEVVDGHYQFPLLLRDKTFKFPNNKSQALQSAEWLERKLQNNKQMHEDYYTFMSNIFEKGTLFKHPHGYGRRWNMEPTQSWSLSSTKTW